MPRKRIFTPLVLTLIFLALTGCTSKPAPQTAPPALAAAAPAPAPPPAPAPVVADPVEAPVEKSLQELQVEFESKGLLGHVYFDFDQAELRPDASERLAKSAEFLRTRPELSFTIQGHCDERGTSEYNLALGLKRATVAADYLTSNGVAAGRLKIVSFGEERPFCNISNEECWQKNRRAHFLLTGRN